MAAISLTLSLESYRLAVCRMGPNDEIPEWAMKGRFSSVTRTAEELSLVCEETLVPAGPRVERGWSCFRVVGTLDFGLTGILAAVLEPLALEKIGVFTVSTFDTDYVLVKATGEERAAQALRAAGHTITRTSAAVSSAPQ